METSTIAQALKQILKADGTLTPNAVVKAAENPTHPLHSCFDWNDKSAAHEYRIWQARMLIKSVRVDVVYEDRTIAAPVYVRDPRKESDEQGYIETRRGSAPKELALDIFRQEISRVESALERAQGVAVILKIEAPLRKLTTKTMRELDRLVERARSMTP